MMLTRAISSMTDKSAYTTNERRWQAVTARDPGAEGTFWFAVTTTGVYCRPTCRSRQPLRQNVRFFDSPEAAEAAGFRPCKRCQPRQATPAMDVEHANAIEQACALIRDGDPAPTLATLAAAVGMSPYHFQRLFKARLGVTPKQYAMDLRRQRAAQALQGGTSVTAALYDAGYGSSGHFYGESDDTLGMTPTPTGAAQRAKPSASAWRNVILGWVLVAATARGLCAIDLGDDPKCWKPGCASAFPTRRSTTIGAFSDWTQQVVTLPGCAGARAGPAARHPGHGLSAPGVGRAARDSSRQHAELHGGRRAHRRAHGRARRGRRLCRQQAGRGDSLPSRRAPERRPQRLSLGHRAQAKVAWRENRKNRTRMRRIRADGGG